MTGEVDFGFFFLLICLHFSYGAIVLKKILKRSHFAFDFYFLCWNIFNRKRVRD
jgi:hypothetical protein